METVELLVYIAVTVMAGGLVVIMLRTMDHEKNYDDYVKVFNKEETHEFKVVSSDFARELAKRWETCRFGIDNRTFAVQVTDTAVLNRSAVIMELLREDKCDVIDCRNRTNGFIMPNSIITPKILNIRCFNNSLIVE